MPTRPFGDSDPARLAGLLNIPASSADIWQPEDLGGILRHQLSVPLQLDLGNLPEAAAGRPWSFADLLHHPEPPVELLILTKRFAKTSRHRPDSPLPRAIATLIYFASIAAALARCQQRITKLDDQALRDGFVWAHRQDWVDDATRALFTGGLKALET